MRTRAKSPSLSSCLALAVPAFAATTPTGKSGGPRSAPTTARATGTARSRSRPTRRRRTSASARTASTRAKKPALVLDIDETSLNNYPCLNQQGRHPLRRRHLRRLRRRAYNAPAIRPVRSLFRLAKHLRVRVVLHHRPPRGDPRRHAPEPEGGRLQGASTSSCSSRRAAVQRCRRWFRTRAAPASRSSSAGTRSSPTSATSERPEGRLLGAHIQAAEPHLPDSIEASRRARSGIACWRSRERAPEHIALAASERFGPAGRGVGARRRRGPHARAARADRLPQARAARAPRGRRARAWAGSSRRLPTWSR